MRVVRAMGGALLWILASVVGLVAILLCVTLILLPLGLPLLALARRLYGLSIRLFLPRSAAHPLKAAADAARSTTRDAADGIGDRANALRSSTARSGKKARKQLAKKWKNTVNV